MPRGDKSAYTDKQKRKAEHIEEGYEERGVPKKEAAARAWATVNKESGGGNKSGSGRGVPDTKAWRARRSKAASKSAFCICEEGGRNTQTQRREESQALSVQSARGRPNEAMLSI